MDKRVWNTYYRTGYTYDVANDQASAGGVHLHQVRKSRTGWQRRIVQSNGAHVAYGPTVAISEEEGKAMFETASQLQARADHCINGR